MSYNDVTNCQRYDSETNDWLNETKKEMEWKDLQEMGRQAIMEVRQCLLMNLDKMPMEHRQAIANCLAL